MFSVVKKLVAALGVATATLLLLSACMKFDVNLTVNGDDTVSGSATIAMTKEMASVGEGQNDEGWVDPESTSDSTSADGSYGFSGLFSEGPGVEEAPYEDEKFIGTTYTFKNVPLENFAVDESNPSQISIVREGDKLITSGTLDLGGGMAAETTDGFSGSDDFSNQMFESLGESAEMKISITYPGQILETNGTVEGQTVTWTPKFGESLEMKAVVSAPPTNWALIGLFIGAVVLVAAAVVVIIVLRRRKSKQSGDAEAAGDVAVAADASAATGSAADAESSTES